MQFLESDKVYLKKLSVHDDMENYLQMVNDEKNVFSIESLARDHLRKEDLIEFVSNYNGKLFGVFDKQDEHVGNISLSSFDYVLRCCSYAVLMSSKHKRKGYAFEGSKLVLNHAFNNLNLHRVYLGVVEWADSAIKLYEKLGFQYEGSFRDAFWANGQYYNQKNYSLLKTDFKFLKKDIPKN
tara:strand:- start:11 stop:556 length:546 start_codon:yes stop_codon:yes gene_type:complete